MNFDKLTSTLRVKVENRPTKTLLRSSSPEAESVFSKLPKSIPKIKLKLPKDFNGIKVWGDLLSPIKDQGKCGSCWAFSTTSSLADKFNIQTMGQVKIDLSPAKLVLCDWQGKELEISEIRREGHQQTLLNVINQSSEKTVACTGNTLMDAWRYLFLIGTVEEKCIPYTLRPGRDKPLSEYTSNEKLPLCTDISSLFGDMCINYKWNPRLGLLTGTPSRFWRAYRYYVIPGVPKDKGNIEIIMQAIYKWGPVTSGMKVYPDYYTFDPVNDIYEWDGIGPQVGGHGISIVGWGEDNGVKFWWIRNSWGKNWGINGYFRMIRGTNNCEIEENVMTGAPDFFYPLGWKVVGDQEFGDIAVDITSQIHDRINIDTGINAVASGIEPTTGYSRKAMVKLPGFDFSVPIFLNELPNYKKFIAGIDGSRDNVKKYWRSIKSEKKVERLEKENNFVVKTVLIMLIIVIIVVIFFSVSRYFMKRRFKNPN